MKKPLLLFLCSIALTRADAQHWAPFNLREQFNFTDDSTIVISANFFVDSATTINGDSVFYLNRVVTDVPIGTATDYYSLKNQPQFWQKTMAKKADGNYNFREPGNLLLKPNAVLNDSWVFDSLKNITATVTRIMEENIFSSNDSVKTILLSSNDTIKLSKHYGLLQFPYDSLNTLKLVGIEGRNLGELMPNFYTIFNFNINDVFWSVSSACNFTFPPMQAYWTATHSKILEKQFIPDSAFIYKTLWEETIRDADRCGPGALDTILKGKTGSAIYEFRAYPWLKRPACNSLTLQTVSFGSYVVINNVIKRNGRKVLTIHRPIFSEQEAECTTCGDSIHSGLQFEFGGYELTEGAGITWNELSSYEWKSFTEITCFDNTDSASNFCGDVFYSGIEENNQPYFSIYPNPFSEEIHLNSLLAKNEIIIYNLLGQVVFNKKESSATIDTRQLRSGQYILEIKDGSKNFRRIITKIQD